MSSNKGTSPISDISLLKTHLIGRKQSLKHHYRALENNGVIEFLKHTNLLCVELW